jgi:ketosteroid isomerase-like protein
MSLDVDGLAARNEEWRQAIEDRDQERAAQILDADYALVLVHPAPATVPRAQWLAMLPDYVVHSWDVREQRVEVEGDVGLVCSLVDMRATVLGEDRSGPFVITDIWLARDGDWHVWRRHSAPLSAGPMPVGS